MQMVQSLYALDEVPLVDTADAAKVDPTGFDLNGFVVTPLGGAGGDLFSFSPVDIAAVVTAAEDMMLDLGALIRDPAHVVSVADIGAKLSAVTNPLADIAKGIYTDAVATGLVPSPTAADHAEPHQLFGDLNEIGSADCHFPPPEADEHIDLVGQAHLVDGNIVFG